MLLAKLNIHAEGTWTVSRELSPNQLMTLGGLQTPQGMGLYQEGCLHSPGPALEEGTLLTLALSVPPRHHRTPCPLGKQTLLTKIQQRNLLGGVILSLVLKAMYYSRGKLQLLLVKGVKAMQKEDLWDSKSPPELQGKAGCLCLLVVFAGSFLDRFGHPAPAMKQEQQQRPSFKV